MILLYALMIASLVGAGVYLLLQRSMLRIFLGLSLMSYGMNLFLFMTPGFRRGKPALIDANGQLAPESADPLPQALILTAIVIGFGLSAFYIVLARRATQNGKRDDTESLGSDEDPS